MLRNKRIILALTGGIALYKWCAVVRGLVKAGAVVRIAMTENATRFVTPVTFEALSGHPVALTEWAAGPEGAMPHIELTRDANLLVVGPATANILAKAAHGIADDLVSTLIAARRCPTAVVPAMNVEMWTHPANQRNVKTLKDDGFLFFGPAQGSQACGDVGEGRMIEPEEILERIAGAFVEKTLTGRRVVMTAGPTYEAIDAVRGITNRSSGRQGFALARAFRDAGAEVVVVAGPVTVVPPPGVEVRSVTSALEMKAAVDEALNEKPAHIFAGVAAVADWRPEAAVDGKIKKKDLKSEEQADGKTEEVAKSPMGPQLRWVENPDILQGVAARRDVPVTVGFAAECADVEAYAREKCRRKGCAFVVANDARTAPQANENRVLIVTPSETVAYGPATKDDVARFIVARAAAALRAREEDAAEGAFEPERSFQRKG